MSDALLFTVSLAITLLGLAGSWRVAQRRGYASGARGAAWSLVPMGLYLTGLTEFFTDLVFSPVKWAGVILLGLAGVLYVTSGVKLRAAAGVEKPPRAARPGRAPKAVDRPGQSPAGLDPDLADIDEILRRRGIN
ncbi:MAG: hypothetical protein ABIS86_24460 [Streptosporangiaceae bacterium]